MTEQELIIGELIVSEEAEKQLAIFNIQTAALEEMKSKALPLLLVKPEGAPRKQMLAVKEVVSTCRGARTGVGKSFKEQKKPVLEKARFLDNARKFSDTEIFKIENPAKEWLRRWEVHQDNLKQERIKREERRVAGIKATIDTMFGLNRALDLQGGASSEIEEVLIEVREQDITDTLFSELTNDAANAKADCIVALERLLEATVKREEAEAEAARLEAERKKQEEIARKEREAREEQARKEREVLEREKEKLRLEREELERKQREAQEEADRLRRQEEERQAEAARKLAEEERQRELEQAEKEALAAQETVEEDAPIEEVMATITIPLGEYNQLLADQALLRALQGAGVDNWSGYDEALDAYEREKARLFVDCES